ncbi:MAG: 50S ribosomal protein L28 [Bacteroidaceae bacterium]|nr:50S ribosomal protein L28 [Bacteroidaceae bacterium]
MSKICQITGKKAMVGNNVSHSKRRTKRTFDVNLFTKKFYYVEEDCWISLKLSAAGLRLINKLGLDAALKQAVENGYLDWKEIKVLSED